MKQTYSENSLLVKSFEILDLIPSRLRQQKSHLIIHDCYLFNDKQVLQVKQNFISEVIERQSQKLASHLCLILRLCRF